MVGNYVRIDMDWLDFRERILRYFRVFEGESSFTALFNDIFSYISKTTGPILILCCSVYSLSSSEHVFPISRQNRFSSFRDIAKKGFTAFLTENISKTTASILT